MRVRKHGRAYGAKFLVLSERLSFPETSPAGGPALLRKLAQFDKVLDQVRDEGIGTRGFGQALRK